MKVLWDTGIKHLDRDSGPLTKLARKIYGPGVVRSGRTYHDIIRHRREKGELHGDDRTGGMIFRNAPAVIVVEGDGDPDAEAAAFVRFCYRRRAVQWPELYDEMCAVAARGEYRGMDYEQLQGLGIGFALAALPGLAALSARVIAEERGPQPVVAVA